MLCVAFDTINFFFKFLLYIIEIKKACRDDKPFYIYSSNNTIGA
jgi:hypothetical protein